MAFNIYNGYKQAKAYTKYRSVGNIPPEEYAKIKKNQRINWIVLGIFVVSSFLLYFIAFGLQE
jgi:hypothetical protein